MKAEISQFGYDRRHRFSGVYQQQGRMMLDRDWNDLCDIVREQIQTAADEALGTGVPRHDGLLSAGTGLDQDQLVLRATGGSVGADGLLGEAGPRSEAGDGLYLNQRDLPAETWRLPGADQPLATQALLTALNSEAHLYVDIWDRLVTVFEGGESANSALFDPALHGADTCVRKQRMVQIKAAGAEDVQETGDPCRPRFDPNRIPQAGNAEIEISLLEAVDTGNACDPCPDEVTIERAVTNHLFRIEVHRVDFDESRRPVSLWLKWSNDNGARELRAGEWPAAADPEAKSYEFFSDATEHLLGMPSDDWVSTENLAGLLDPETPANVMTALPRIREWDGWCELQLEGDTWTFAAGRHGGRSFNQPGSTVRQANIEDGRLRLTIIDKEITLPLADQRFLAGDYWLALVRRRAEETQRLKVLSATPIGVKHHYCLLGAAQAKDGDTVISGLTPHDLRRLQHPSLTCLTSGDIGHDAGCNYFANVANVNTVDEALEALCVKPAAFVPYTPSCTYLADIRKTDTVAKALEALCSKPAEFVPFSPVCDYLQAEKADTVAKALEALCRREANVQNLPKVIGTNWENDQPLRLKELVANGLEVQFRGEDLIREVSTDSFILTVELPREIRDLNGTDPVPMPIPQIVLGGVTQPSSNMIQFKPSTIFNDATLNFYLERLKGMKPDYSGIRCRVRVQGRSIWFKDERGGVQNLDGHVPLEPNKKAHNFKAAGVGHVSDFESWFYLVTEERVSDRRFAVRLQVVGNNTDKIVDLVQREGNMSRSRATTLVNGSLPAEVRRGLSQSEAANLVRQFEELGAKAEALQV